jgi:hypothetical protein
LSDDAPLPPVVHNARAARFELTVDGRLAHADYDLDGGVMRIHHTEVPRAVGGRGHAARLVAAALAYAQAEGLQVEPWCSYVRGYMRRHPETHALLPEGFRL